MAGHDQAGRLRPPGTVRPQRFRPRLHYELLVCGLRGHALVGTDAAELRPQDSIFARELEASRWYRCLRCDSWLPLGEPATAARRHPPERDEIRLPLRGKALRDALAGRKPPARNADPVPSGVSVDGWTFPIRGAHNYGDAADRYGAPRDGHTHAGQDILASCGLPEVAARAGKVIDAGYGGSAGYYIAVHTLDTPYDYFYAHLRQYALVRQGQSVTAGQLVGYVGETGDATACHLHFELWQGAWWNGGHTIDPLPFLRAWDRTS